MIGFLLVLISFVVACCRSLWRSLVGTRPCSKTGFGRRFHVVARSNRPFGHYEDLLFLQYFIRGNEYWFVAGEPPLPSLCRTLTKASVRELARHKVDSAKLFSDTGKVDVTQWVRELAGPGMNFHGDLFAPDIGIAFGVNQDVLREYLMLRAKLESPERQRDFEGRWSHCDVRIIPGSMEPFAPLTFDMVRP